MSDFYYSDRCHELNCSLVIINQKACLWKSDPVCHWYLKARFWRIIKIAVKQHTIPCEYCFKLLLSKSPESSLHLKLGSYLIYDLLKFFFFSSIQVLKACTCSWHFLQSLCLSIQS